MIPKVLDDPAIEVRLHWRIGEKIKWQQFGVDCRVSDLPSLALNILRKRVSPKAAVMFGITVCGNGQTVANLQWDDFKYVLETHAVSQLSEEGLIELRRRILNPYR